MLSNGINSIKLCVIAFLELMLYIRPYHNARKLCGTLIIDGDAFDEVLYTCKAETWYFARMFWRILIAAISIREMLAAFSSWKMLMCRHSYSHTCMNYKDIVIARFENQFKIIFKLCYNMSNAIQTYILENNYINLRPILTGKCQSQFSVQKCRLIFCFKNACVSSLYVVEQSYDSGVLNVL